MPMLRLNICGRGAWSLFVVLAVVAMSAGPVRALQSENAPANAPYTMFEVRPAEQMDEQDAAAVKAKHREIVTEAAFWGYDLNAGQWTWDQVVCPEIPDAAVLHYRKKGSKGEFLFTAVVPRATGRVLVAPVLYGGATPFESATGAKRTTSVFDQAVPAELAKRDIEPEGHWLQLAMTYAVIAGAEPRVPNVAEQQPGLMKAPEPDLTVSQASHAREVIFSDHQAPRHYTVWTIDFNGQGRATDANASTIADYVPAAQKAAEPPQKETQKKVKKTQEMEEPKVKVIPEPPEPTPKPAPQG